MNQQDHTADTIPRSANPPRTAFVTGGTGFLGLNLVRQLSEAGWEVKSGKPLRVWRAHPPCTSACRSCLG